MNILSETPYLVRNPEAVRLQERGLAASLAGDQTAARALYADALEQIPADDTADTAAQRAGVLRDDAFTYVREGVTTSSPENFHQATERLRRAVGETALEISGAVDPNFKQTGPHDTYKKPRRELYSAHAATLGLLARTATAQEVTLSESTAETRTLRARYGFAHDYARLGTNGYFRVSNAMNGARDERIQGRLPHTAVWVARAAFGIVWSVKNDRGNLRAAARTFVGRLADLRSSDAARQSVASRP